MLKQIVRPKWGIELFALFLASLGFFLLIEPFQLEANLSYLLWISNQGINVILKNLVNSLIHTQFSHIVGLLLLGISISLILKQFKHRLQTSQVYGSVKCPICQSKLRRRHRHFRDRLINFFIPVYRYQCRNRQCGWTGLRIRPFFSARNHVRSHETARE